MLIVAFGGIVRTVICTSRAGGVTAGAGVGSGAGSTGWVRVIGVTTAGAGVMVGGGGSAEEVPSVPLASTTTTPSTVRPAPTGNHHEEDFSRTPPVATPRSTVDAPSRVLLSGTAGEVGRELRPVESGRSDGPSLSLAAASLMLRDFWSISSPRVERKSAVISRSFALEPVLAIQPSRATRRSSQVWYRWSASLARALSTMAASSGG